MLNGLYCVIIWHVFYCELLTNVVQKLQNIGRNSRQDQTTSVARICAFSMVTYFDQWLLFGPQRPMDLTVPYLERFHVTFSMEKSIMHPRDRLIYLGLFIDTTLDKLL